MDLVNLEQFKKTEEYQEFINENKEIGLLKVIAFTAYQAMPIEGVEILITRDFGNKKVLFFSGYTNSSGIIDNIKLPAPTNITPTNNQQEPLHTDYNLTAIKSEFETIQEYKIEMLGNIKSIQYIKMIPNVELGEENGSSL